MDYSPDSMSLGICQLIFTKGPFYGKHRRKAPITITSKMNSLLHEQCITDLNFRFFVIADYLLTAM